MRGHWRHSLSTVGIAGLCGALAVTARAAGPLTPAETLAAFETEPGLGVELVAAEPLVVDPVALAFDQRGRLYVAENRDYPAGTPGGRPLGVIARLEDTDGDGRMDRRTVFADGIAFPNGVLPWRDGVIVTAAPDVLWLRDTDDDGRADARRTLLTGFALGGSSQLRVNDPTLGPDGWVYLAGGLSGGEVFSPEHPARKLDLAKGDLRFRPDTGELEPVPGKGQYGLAFDDAGRRFTCMNRIQVQHAPPPPGWRPRNPHAALPGPLHNCPELIENTLLVRQGNAGARIFPISANITTADSHAGTYSAACAVHVYRGDALPAAYHGTAFSCDPTANLVRADRLVKQGGTFAARRIHADTEALRSRDDWFRPVFLADGPDGALYVADMYRGVIEHPEYLPEEVRKHLDFRAGDDRGRIWRLKGKAPSPGSHRPFPADAEGGTGLAGELTSPVPWRRDTAFRLLVERGGTDAVPALRGLAAGRTASPAAGRLAALRLLGILGALDDATLAAGLAADVPEIRQVSLALAEPRLAASADLREKALRLADDPDPHVRFQAALSLPAAGGPRVIPAIARLGLAGAEDPWTRAAVLGGVATADEASALLAELARATDGEGRATLLGETARVLAALLPEEARPDGFAQLLRVAAPAGFDARAAAVAGFHAGGGLPPSARENEAVTELVREASRLAADPAAPPARRARAATLVGLAGAPAAVAALPALLAPGQPAALQEVVLLALVQPAHTALGPALFAEERWRGYAPGLRATLLGTVVNRPEFWPALLDAVEAGHVPAGSLNSAQRGKIRAAKDAAVREHAEALLAGASGDRLRAYEAAKASLALTPAPARGREVFTKNCAACHRFNREGVAVGPDLFDIRNQSKEAILLHIVLPEQEVAPNFVAYDCETKDGRSLSGLLARETPAAVTLRMAQGLEETVPRDQVASLQASRLSLMPQELEQAMSGQEMADLLAYLRGEQ